MLFYEVRVFSKKNNPHSCSFSLPRTRSASGVKWSGLVSIYMFICLWTKKYLNRTLAIDSPFQTFARISRRIYRLPLRAPETLSSLSKSRISIFNAHLTPFVHMMMSHNSIGKYHHLVNWIGTCFVTEHRHWQTRLVESLQNWKEVNVWGSTYLLLWFSWW